MHRRAGGRPLFRDLNLSIGREQVAVIGRNGVGKSSLLEVLAGHEHGGRRPFAAPAGGCWCVSSWPAERCARGCGVPGSSAVGPWSRRAARRPDLLLLDEPTQDLDAQSIGWLLELAEGWEQGLIVVSHDRRVLRRFRHFFVVAESGCRYFAGSFDELMQDLRPRAAMLRRPTCAISSGW